MNEVLDKMGLIKIATALGLSGPIEALLFVHARENVIKSHDAMILLGRETHIGFKQLNKLLL